MITEDKAYKKLEATEFSEVTEEMEYIETINPNIKQSSVTIKRLFDIHNKYFENNKEYGNSCGSCRARVWKKLLKLKTHYNDKINNK